MAKTFLKNHAVYKITAINKAESEGLRIIKCHTDVIYVTGNYGKNKNMQSQYLILLLYTTLIPSDLLQQVLLSGSGKLKIYGMIYLSL
jgi:hypothetical protein